MTGIAWLYTRGSERQVTLKPNAALRRAGFEQTTLCDASALSSQSLSLSEAREEIERLSPYREELQKIAADVGEPDDPFAAWETIAALKALAKPDSSPAGGDVREALAFVGELEALAFSKQMSQRPLDYEQVQTIFKAVASIRAALQSTSAGRVGE